MVPRSVCVPSNLILLSELAVLLAHEWGDELQKKQAGIYSVAVGVCQLPLLQSLPGFGLDGSTGNNGASSTVRVCL